MYGQHVFILFLILLPISFSCPAGFSQGRTHDVCYKYVSQPLPWPHAEYSCSQAGGHLVSIQSAIDNSYTWGAAGAEFGGVQDWWLGGSMTQVLNNWTWSDGATFVYNNWMPGQPTLKNTCFNCVAQNKADGTWSSDSCDVAKPYVCELHIAPTCPELWSYFDKTQSCYMRLYSFNFTGAEAQCVQNSSHLVSVHSDEEHNFLMQNMVFGYAPHLYSTNVLIGLHYVNGSWVWTDGSPVDYRRWGPGRPLSNMPTCTILYANIVNEDYHYNPDWQGYWDNNLYLDYGEIMAICKRAAVWS